MKLGLVIDSTLLGIVIGIGRIDANVLGVASKLQIIGINSSFGRCRSGVCLAQLVSCLLLEKNCSINDIEFIVVSVGPGSFTGIKVGISFAQGLVLGMTSKPKLIGVSSLNLLANLDSFLPVMYKVTGWFVPTTLDQGFGAIRTPYKKDAELCVVSINHKEVLIKAENSFDFVPLENLFLDGTVNFVSSWPKLREYCGEKKLSFFENSDEELAKLIVNVMFMEAIKLVELENNNDFLLPQYLKKSIVEENTIKAIGKDHEK